MIKLVNLLQGLFYTISSIMTFDPEKEFAGKKIAIVGPADSAFEVENGKKIDSFDYVVRINKAPGTWNSTNEKFIGTKTDIWFHSFFENKISGGGPLSREIMNTREISKIINPRTSFDAYRRTFNFFRKYGRPENTKICHLPIGFYKSIDQNFPEGLRPTVGFTALVSALESACEELFITGFTFFKTPYAKGYRDHLIDLKENKKHFKKQGIHDADLEYTLFKDYLKNSKCKQITLDDKLTQILDNPE